MTEQRAESLALIAALPALYVPDATSATCMGGVIRTLETAAKPPCGKIFSIMVWKHHCRLCGLLFCNDCTQYRMTVAPAFKHGDTIVRVCHACWTRFKLKGAPQTPEEMYAFRLKVVENGGIIDIAPKSQSSTTESSGNVPQATAVEGETKSSSSLSPLPEVAAILAALAELGLQNDGDTSRDAIRQSYQKLMRSLHPDKRAQQARRAAETAGGGEAGAAAAEIAKAEAEARFDRVQRAYKFLTRDEEEIQMDAENDAKKAAVDEAQSAHMDAGNKSTRHLKEDTVEASCALCHRPFSLFFRRHHCRRCLVAVCNDCGGTMKSMSSLNTEEPVRWCDRCVALVDEHGEEAPKDLLMLESVQIVPLPEPEEEYLFLRSVETHLSVATSPMEDGASVQFYDVSIHWYSQEPQTGHDIHHFDHNETLGAICWTVQHRYSEFVWLDTELRKLLGKHGVPCTLPTKGHIFVTKDDAFLRDRAKGLETYCQFLATHTVMRQPLSYMRKLGMRATFIKATFLVRAFFALPSREWQEVQKSGSAGDGIIKDISGLDDIERWKRYLIEKWQVDDANTQFEVRIDRQEDRAAERCERMEDRNTRQEREATLPPQHSARKERNQIRVSQCTQRTTREKGRLEQQQESDTLVHISDRTADDEQRQMGAEEKSTDDDAFEVDKYFLSDADEKFLGEQVRDKRKKYLCLLYTILFCIFLKRTFFF